MKDGLFLFGAGKYGKKALDFLGDEQVEGFIDNDTNKVGRYCHRKLVISLEQLADREQTIIIASAQHEAIAKQLEEAGYHRYLIYRPSEVEKAIKVLQPEKIQGMGALLSREVACNDALQLVLLNKKLFPDTPILLDPEYDNQFCLAWKEFKFEKLSELPAEISDIFIIDPVYHMALEARARKVLKGRPIKIINPYRRESFYSKKQLVINKYLNEAVAKTEEDFAETQKKQNGVRRGAAAFVAEHAGAPPLFELLEIETVNRCNGVCSFCPVNRNVDTREPHLMDESLFDRIVDELACIGYAGKVSLYSNNEPLLDERILKFSAKLRKKVPDAYIFMFTNGTLLTMDIFKGLIPNLDELIIDNYNQALNIIPSVQKVKAHCESHPELIEKVSIVMRKPDEILLTRGGNAPNRTHLADYPDIPCALVYQQMVVRPTGQVSLCCNDALGQHTLGDVSKDGLQGTWYGKRYQQVRRALDAGRKNFGQCRYCDDFPARP